MTIDLSPKALRNASTTIPAPKITWDKGIRRMTYATVVDGATYLLAKSGRSRDSVWHLLKLNKTESCARAGLVWEAICLNDGGSTVFGHTLATAKANAAMHLVRGAHPERSDWVFDR